MRAHWGVRLRDTLSTYLPLLIMVTLALITWWLARNAPQPEAQVRETAPRHEPDYIMQGVTLQRFDAEGALRVEVRGDHLRHYPDDDTVEVDKVHIQSWGQDQQLTSAVAQRAVTTSAAAELRLQGGAQVTRAATTPEQQAIHFSSEFLHVLIDARQVRTHLPVKLLVGTSDVRAAGLDYAEEPQLLQLQGPLHVVLQADLQNRRKAAR